MESFYRTNGTFLQISTRENYETFEKNESHTKGDFFNQDRQLNNGKHQMQRSALMWFFSELLCPATQKREGKERA